LFWKQYSKSREKYQIATTLPYGHKIHQMTVKYSKWP
jgi:hypothetical protein